MTQSAECVPVGGVCCGCGYDLRGVPMDGARCPECGLDVKTALFGKCLWFADARWVMGLWRGVNLILCGLIGAAVFPITAIVAAPLGIATILSNAVVAIGVWKLAAPDPSDPVPGRWLRFAVRMVTIVQLVLAVVATWTSIFDLWFGTLVGILLTGFGISVCAQGALLCWLLSRLATRLPVSSLAVLSRTVSYGFIGSAVLLGLFLAERSSMEWAAGLAALGGLGSGFLGFVVLMQFAAALGIAREKAEMNVEWRRRVIEKAATAA